MASGLPSGGFDSPKLNERRERAMARRMDVPGTKKRASQNKNPERPLQNYLANNGSMAPHPHLDGVSNPGHSDEKMKAGDIFDSASVAFESFDDTLSSLPLEEAQHHRNGYEGDSGEDGHKYGDGLENAWNIYPENGYGNHNAGHQRNGHGLGRAGSRGQQNTSDDDYFSDSDDDRKGQVEDDQTLMAQNPAFAMLNDVQNNPNFNAYKTRELQRPSAPNRFANNPVMNQGRDNHQLTDFDAQQLAYKIPTSATHAHGYSDDVDRHASPTVSQYVAHKQHSPSLVDGHEIWAPSDGLDNENQDQGQMFPAPNGDRPDSRQMAESAQQSRGNQHYNENEEVNGVNGSYVDSIDYSEEDLYKMDYATLRDQPFDAEPAEVTSENDKPTGPAPPATLERRLEQMLEGSDVQQSQLFSTMSKEDWEKSGDWFMTQFANVMNKMKQSRESRRGITKKFEDELAAREEAVSGKTKGIEKELSDMKSGGQGVLNRKPKAISTTKKSRGEAVVNRNGVDKGTSEKKSGGGKK